MACSRRRAFTLIEVLVVVTIIGLLLALLLPTMGQAWEVVHSTQCQSNLSTLYKANTNWTADRDATSGGTLDAGWAGSLKDYLENSASALRCPSAKANSLGMGGSGSGGNPGTGQMHDAETGSGRTGRSTESKAELKDVGIGVLDSKGKVLYEIPISPSSYWTMYQSWALADGKTLHIESNIDHDMTRHTSGPENGLYSDDDFVFDVTFKDGHPWKVKIGNCDGSANGSNGTYSDFRVGHQPMWGGQRFGNEPFATGHIGETINLEEVMDGMPSTDSSGRRPTFSYWTVLAASWASMGETSYGVSRGSFQRAKGALAGDISRPDPKSFFILDYPRVVADYTDISDDTINEFYQVTCINDKPNWYNIFISPVPKDDWKAPTGLEGRTWEEVQALRHFGRANVLFCDGHIESLEPQDLRWDDMRWRFGGR